MLPKGNDRVVSFCQGLAIGYSHVFAALDTRVGNLGDVHIINIEDALYPALGGKNGRVSPEIDSCIVRVVTYRKR